MRRRSKEVAADGPSLTTKVAPTQERARATFELILEVTGELLAEIGFERLSTNLICERAGITPPALYRYFPNKYAILREMGRRLMEAEDAIVLRWLQEDDQSISASLDEAVAQRAALMAQVREVVRAQPGGAWILRAMRAVPVLHDVRDDSVSMVADAIADRLRAAHPDADAERLKVAATLTTAMTSLANEMILDDSSLEGAVTHEMSRMVTLYYRDLLGIPRRTEGNHR